MIENVMQRLHKEDDPAITLGQNFAERREGFEFVWLQADESRRCARVLACALLLLPEEVNYVFARSGDFINEMVEAVMTADPNGFRKKYTEADILFLSEFEGIVGKEASQTEFCRILRERLDAKKPVLLTGKPADAGYTEELTALMQRMTAVRFDT